MVKLGAANMKILTSAVSAVGLSLLMIGSAAYADVAATYNKSCATCHDSGALNAPKKGDVAKWQSLKSQKGMDALIKSTRQGMPQMPAKGLCQTCSDDDFRSLIDYMSK